MNLPPGRYVENGREYVFDECPACGRSNSFYWNSVKEAGQCWSQKHCGIVVWGSENLEKILLKLGIGLLPNLEDVEVRERTMTWSLKGSKPVHESLRGQAFLVMKDLPLDLASECGLRVDEKEVNIVAPLYCVDSNEPSAHMTRSVLPREKGWRFCHHHEDPNYEAHKGLYCFAPPQVIRRPGRTRIGVLVEGVGDLIKHPLLVNFGVAMLGVKMDPCVGEWLSRKFENLIVWGDNDKAGDKLYKAAKGIMRGFGVRCKQYKDPRVKDPGDAEPVYSFETLDGSRRWR